jgi:hypothetical protein
MKKITLTLTLIFLFIGINVLAGEGDFIVNGKLGLGTTNPTGIFEVAGQVSVSATNAIPAMISNTSPAGVASADSEYSSSHYQVWRAMDKDNSSYLSSWISNENRRFPHWLRYQFPSGKTITSYSITARNISENANYLLAYPTAWTLQGSNDGNSWTDLDSRSGESFNQSQKKIYTFSNSNSYIYYRLYLTAGIDSIFVSIGELELMESAGMTLASFLYVDKTTGNIGIWTTTPGNYKLSVNGSIYASSIQQGSDIRWKKNITTIKNAQSLVKKLQGVRFDWKKDEFKDKNFDSGRQIGLIAQDVEKVLPEIVKTDTEGYKAVAYDKLTAVLIEAFKEQQNQINELKAEITNLKKR